MKILDVGSGLYPVKDADSIDFADLPNLTYKWDLNKFPYPILDNYYDIVYCSHTLEHLDDIGKVLAEFKRILKPKGEIHIKVPYLTSNNAFQDYSHKHWFTYYSFDYFVTNPDKHMQIWFSPQILIMKSRRFIFVRKGIRLFLNFFLEKFANRYPMIYENMFKYTFPPYELEVRMTK